MGKMKTPKKEAPTVAKEPQYPTAPQMAVSASLFANELAGPFSSASVAMAEYSKTLNKAKAQESRGSGQQAYYQYTTYAAPTAPSPPPFVGIDSATASLECTESGPWLKKGKSTIPVSARSGKIGGSGKSDGGSGKSDKKGKEALIHPKIKELDWCLGLLAQAVEGEPKRNQESPIQSFAAMKFLEWVDENLRWHIKLLSDSQLHDVFGGLKIVCKLGFVFTSLALTLLADLVESDHRASVILYHILKEDNPSYLRETNLFILLACLKEGPLKKRLLLFSMTLIQRRIITQKYIVQHIQSLDKSMVHRLMGSNPYSAYDNDVTGILNRHWVSKMTIDFQAYFTPLKTIKKNQEASLYAAVFETESTYFECPELCYPPYLFDRYQQPPPSTTLMQAHVFYDPNEGIPGMSFQQYRLEIEILCTHDAIDHTVDSILYCFAQHYWPASMKDVDTSLPIQGPSGPQKVGPQTPKFHILRARHDVRSLLTSKGRSSGGDSPTQNQQKLASLMEQVHQGDDYMFLSEAGEEMQFRLAYRRKLILPFFLSKKYPAFLFTLQVNHNNRFGDLNDDIAISEWSEAQEAAMGTRDSGRWNVSTSSSRGKDRRFEKGFGINSAHFEKEKSLREAEKTVPPSRQSVRSRGTNLTSRQRESQATPPSFTGTFGNPEEMRLGSSETRPGTSTTDWLPQSDQEEPPPEYLFDEYQQQRQSPPFKRVDPSLAVCISKVVIKRTGQPYIDSDDEEGDDEFEIPELPKTEYPSYTFTPSGTMPQYL